VLTIVLLSRFENAVVGKNRNVELYIEIRDVNKANQAVDIITGKGHKITRLEITPARSGIVNSLGLEVTFLLGKGVEKKQISRKSPKYRMFPLR
jgi:hypothetical protein